MKAVIINYDAGNIESVLNAFSLIKEGGEVVISNNPAEIKSATHLILPGVGAFGDCMNSLKLYSGLTE